MDPQTLPFLPRRDRGHALARRPLLQSPRQNLHRHGPLRRPLSPNHLKCAPEKFHDLLEIEGISPAPYVGRYKWVMLANPNVLPASELEALIRRYYDLVAAKAPKKKSARKKQSPRRSTRN